MLECGSVSRDVIVVVICDVGLDVDEFDKEDEGEECFDAVAVREKRAMVSFCGGFRFVLFS
jgi:hypothetical protein